MVCLLLVYWCGCCPSPYCMLADTGGEGIGLEYRSTLLITHIGQHTSPSCDNRLAGRKDFTEVSTLVAQLGCRTASTELVEAIFSAHKAFHHACTLEASALPQRLDFLKRPPFPSIYPLLAWTGGRQTHTKKISETLPSTRLPLCLSFGGQHLSPRVELSEEIALSYAVSTSRANGRFNGCH